MQGKIMLEEMKVGDVCRARCGAQARYLGGGRCLCVSAMCNDLFEDEALPPTGGEEEFPLPSDEEVFGWHKREGKGGAKALESVAEHNARKIKERKERQEAARKTGVACPKCGGELEWIGIWYQVASIYPPPSSAQAFCKKCKLEIFLER